MGENSFLIDYQWPCLARDSCRPKTQTSSPKVMSVKYSSTLLLPPGAWGAVWLCVMPRLFSLPCCSGICTCRASVEGTPGPGSQANHGLAAFSLLCQGKGRSWIPACDVKLFSPAHPSLQGQRENRPRKLPSTPRTDGECWKRSPRVWATLTA